MTSEICIMNKLAVVLAADSATTVTGTSQNGKEVRYFKGANKIFQLSNFEPVGLMIYASADILGVPWEIVVKAFREHLGDKHYVGLGGYAKKFFEFLDSDKRLFPDAVRRSRFLEAARIASLSILGQQDQAVPVAQRQAEVDARLTAKQNEFQGVQFPSGLDAAFLAASQASVQADLITMIDEWRNYIQLAGPTSPAALADLCCEIVLKTPESYLGTTGLVFAGFGRNDVFPSMLSYKSLGILLTKHVAKSDKSETIKHDTPAALSAFAQTSMSDTFSTGMSFDLYVSFMEALEKGLPEFLNQVRQAHGIQPSPQVNDAALISSAKDGISDTVIDKARTDHALPMRRVLGSLPVDEMAELAETLINLQSLKEKVTMPSQTVGGPTDVAIITRGEGLVWVKRKHFFDPALNSRYMQRQAALYR